jgi:2-polyprenyl-6-methoxyphenol hydroxylase-like FAD-dependent oxidoreductase
VATPVPAAGLPSRVDVAIIGAGYTGLVAARELARAGAATVVLERELFAISIEAIDQLERLIEAEAIACEHHRSGHIQAASRPSQPAV